MGPTGAPTEIAENQNVLLLGGGLLAMPSLFSIAKGMKERGNRVIYFAGYKKGEDLFKQDEMELGDRCRDLEHRFCASRFGPAVRRIATSAATLSSRCCLMGRARWGTPLVPVESGFDRIIAIGSDRMMAAREGGAPRRPRTLPQAESRRDREHQLADAVHDEGSLRAVPAEARGSCNRQGVDHLLVLESGPGDGSRGFRIWRPACGRTRCRKSCRPSGSITSYADSRCTTSEQPCAPRGQGGHPCRIETGARPGAHRRR